MEEELERLRTKVKLLQDRIFILKACGDKSSADVLQEIKETSQKIVRDNDALRYTFNKLKNLNERLSLTIKKVEEGNVELDEIIKNNESNVSEPSDVSNSLSNDLSSPSAQNHSHSLSSYEFTDVKAQKTIPHCIKKPIMYFEIEHLTESELRSVPSYMVGRTSVETINNFIDAVNTAVNKKYTLLAKKRSTLNSSEMRMYMDYKKVEVPELKGKRYVTERDIAEVLNRKMLDKKSLNLMTILRHTKKLIHYRFLDTTVFYPA